MRPAPLALAAALVAAGVVLAYLPGMGAPFYLDDFPQIVEDPIVRDAPARGAAASLAGALSLRWPAERPLARATFVLNRLATGGGPAGFRAVNLLFHLGSFLVLFALLRSLLRWEGGRSSSSGVPGDAVALLAAALWASHPVQTQSVTYVVQRMTSGMTFFFLLSLLAFDRTVSAGTRWGRLAWGGGALLAAVLSLGFKQNAVLIPFFWGGLRAFRARDSSPLAGPEKAAWAVALGLLAAVLLFKGVELARSVSSPEGISFRDHAVTQGRVIALYLRGFFLPFPGRFHLLYDIRPSTGFLSPPSTAAGLLLVAAWAALAAWAWRRDRVAAAALAGSLLALLPESLLPSLDLAFEHRLYLPSIGLCIAAACLGARVASAQEGTGAGRFLRGAGGPVIASFAVLLLLLSTGARNRVWADPERFWEAEVAGAPGNARAHIGRIAALVQSGKYSEASRAGEEAFRREWKESDARSLRLNLALSLLGQGDREGALLLLEPAAASGDPNLFELYNLGVALLGTSGRGRAGAVFEQVLLRDPGHPDANYYSGRILLAGGNPGEAARRFERTLSIRPGDGAAWSGLVSALGAAGDREGAARVADRIAALSAAEPGVGRALPEAGYAYIRAGRFADAERVLSIHLRAHPVDPSAWYNLACAFSLQGKVGESLDALDRSLAAGFRGVVLLKDADLAAVRGSPVFHDLLRKHGILPHARNENGP